MTIKKKKDSPGSPMDAALDYLSPRARTVREVEERLDSLNYGEYEVYSVIERLKEIGYLNDEKYAADFISTRLETKPLSRRKLREQLTARKLPKDTIDEALRAVTDEREAKNALAIAEKYARQFAGLEEDERKLRVMKRLLGRAYDYPVCREAIEAVFGDAEGLEGCTASEDDDED